MAHAITYSQQDFLQPVSKYTEASAYEALWDQEGASFKTLSNLFDSNPGKLPSELISPEKIELYKNNFKGVLDKHGVKHLGMSIYQVDDYPEKLRDAKYPVELFYYQGCWDLVASKCISVVGTRKPSPDGIKRTQKLVKKLVEDGFTIVSGLASGIDKAAHETAIACGGKTIAVIGTPLSHQYPKENITLQQKIADEYLLISQVPFCRYERQNIQTNRFFFPERNVTMSALSVGTIIVEAAETSGTLIQARAALAQERKLFILDNCFHNASLSWPDKFARKGAIRVKEYSDIKTLF